MTRNKKIILGALAAVIVVASAVYGPMLLDLYRLQSYLDKSAAAQDAEGPWPRTADACIGCHGANGNSQHAGYPSLAGQPQAYVDAQLRRFAGGQRANPTMTPLAISMSDAEIQQLAAHFARQVVQPAEVQPKADPALLQKGKALVDTQACAACHGPALMGQQAFPRLAGQGHDYLLTQLDAFANGSRTDPTGTMKPIAAALSAEDRQAIALHLARLAPPAP